MSLKTIIILNRDDVLFVKPLEQFLRKNHRYISKIYYTQFFPPHANKNEYIEKSIKIMGIPYFIKYFLKALAIKVFSHLPVSNKLKKRSSLERLARFYNLELTEVKNVNESVFIKQVREQKIDIILSITSQIYQSEILNIPNLKIYNFHPGLLPNNRGRFPIFWAILKGDPNGITCHEIIPQIDKGKVIYQKVLDLPVKTPVPKVMNYILKNIANFMSEAFERIRNNQIDYPQPTWPSFYGHYPSDSEILRYKKIIRD